MWKISTSSKRKLEGTAEAFRKAQMQVLGKRGETEGDVLMSEPGEAAEGSSKKRKVKALRTSQWQNKEEECTEETSPDNSKGRAPET